jgi:hypothetical protein
MKIPHFAGRKFPTPEPYKAASLASDAVEPDDLMKVLEVCGVEGQWTGPDGKKFTFRWGSPQLVDGNENSSVPEP